MRKFVRAGAGAGKTWNLTREVVRLALQFHQESGQWPKTVLTTFTRKATQELKERILEYCLNEEPEALEFVQSTSFLQITTMHGLLHSFLGRYGQVIGLPGQLKIVDQFQADFWRKQILRELIDLQEIPHSLHFFEFKKLLSNLKSFEKVYWQEEAKTLQSPEEYDQVMQELLSDLIRSIEIVIAEGPLVEPGEKWDDSFKELKGFVAHLSSANDWGTQIETITTFLATFKKPRKSKSNPGLTDDLKAKLEDALKTLKKWTEEPQFDPKSWPRFIEVQKDFMSFANQFMALLIDKKKQEGALEPNDLEFFTLYLLKHHREAIDKFSQDINAWFIDEFQDTSPLQLEILEPMIAESSCYIVGDPQQSIYLFRGSRSEVFFNKKTSMEASGAEILFLQKNYRSQEQLLHFFNELFPALGDGFSKMQATKEKIENQAAVEVYNVTSEEEGLEVDFICEKLAELLSRGVNPKDISVLTRTHAMIDQLQKKLNGLGFPVISHSSSSYFNRREVVDGLALLKFLLNPWDDENLILLLRSPWIALKDREIVEALTGCEKNYWQIFSKKFALCIEGESGFYLNQALNQRDKLGVALSFRQLLLSVGLMAYSQKIDSSGRREANLWKLINLVEKLAREPGASLQQLVKDGSLANTLEDIGNDGDASSFSESNKVQLMTVHASKGLQFDHVLLPFLHKKPLETKFQDFTHHAERNQWSFRIPLHEPNSFVGSPLESLFVRQMKVREREESLRVLYVAMTRAKKHLYLSWQGKPQNQSWAQLMQESLNRKPADGCTIHEIQSAEPTAFRSQDQNEQVRTSWSHGERTPLSAPVDEEEGGSASNRIWKALMQGQKIRREGVVLHKVFETLKNHSFERTLALAENWLPERCDELREAMDFVWNNSEVPLQRIIQQGFVEWGYQHLQNNKLQEKRIDLWGCVDETLWIVDYKTGSTAYKESAFEQMRGYAESLKTYLDWQGPVQLVAVYPFAKKIFKN